MATAPKVNGHSPWGWIQTVDVISPGNAWNVTTASHGGIKLSRSMNAKIPKAARRKGGWYEEDIDWAIVAVAFPEMFTDKTVAAAMKTLKNWLPSLYEAITGEVVKISESMKLQEQAEKEIHRDDWIAVAAWGDWHEGVPKGKVGVVAVKGGRRGGKERWFLVSKSRYKIGKIGYVIDESKDIEVEPFA